MMILLNSHEGNRLTGQVNSALPHKVLPSWGDGVVKAGESP